MRLYPSYGRGNNFPDVECSLCERVIHGDENCYYNDYEEYICQECEESLE